VSISFAPYQKNFHLTKKVNYILVEKQIQELKADILLIYPVSDIIMVMTLKKCGLYLFHFFVINNLSVVVAQDYPINLQLISPFNLDHKREMAKKKFLETRSSLIILDEFQFDLNRDGKKESILLQMIDWRPMMTITTDSGEKFSYLFEIKGNGAHLFQIDNFVINKNNDLLLIFHLYEGHLTAKSKMDASARLFFLTLPQGKFLKNLVLQSGPIIFQENEPRKMTYLNRKKSVEVFDLDHDGEKEIVVSFNNRNEIYKWNKLKWNKI
jgi:hypothetical protein